MAGALAWIMGLKQLEQKKAMHEWEMKKIKAEVDAKARQQKYYDKQTPEKQAEIDARLAGTWRSPQQQMQDAFLKQFTPEGNIGPLNKENAERAYWQGKDNPLGKYGMPDMLKGESPEDLPGLDSPTEQLDAQGLAEKIAMQKLQGFMGGGGMPAPQGAGTPGPGAAPYQPGPSGAGANPMRQKMMKTLFDTPTGTNQWDDGKNIHITDKLGNDVRIIPKHNLKQQKRYVPATADSPAKTIVEYFDPNTKERVFGAVEGVINPTLRTKQVAGDIYEYTGDPATGKPVNYQLGATPPSLGGGTRGLGVTPPPLTSRGAEQPGAGLPIAQDGLPPGVPAGAVKKTEKSPVTVETGKMLNGAKEALNSIDEMEKFLYSPDGSLNNWAMLAAGPGIMPAIPFTVGRDLESLYARMLESKIRMESGAAVPDTEMVRLWVRHMPRLGDSKTLVKSKIRSLRKFYMSTINALDPNEASKLPGDEKFYATTPEGGKEWYRITYPDDKIIDSMYPEPTTATAIEAEKAELRKRLGLTK